MLRLRPWLELARVSNLPTVWTNVSAAWLLAGGALGDGRLLFLLTGGSLLYTAGMILNDAADAAFDREHRRERPIPAGIVSVAAAWSVGVGFLVAGALLMILGGHAMWSWVMALVVAIIAYDLYHKPWPGSVWVMGACRSLLVLAAASGQGITILSDGSRAVAAHAITLGLYVVGLSLVARAEAMGAVKSAVGLFGRGCLLVPLMLPVHAAGARGWRTLGDIGAADPAAIILIAVAFGILVWQALRIMRQGGAAIGRAVGILLAGIPLVDALAIVSVAPWIALGFTALFPLLRLWQRKIAAT